MERKIIIDTGNKALKAMDFLIEIKNKIEEEIYNELEAEKPNFERMHLKAFACKYILDEARIAITRLNETMEQINNE